MRLGRKLLGLGIAFTAAAVLFSAFVVSTSQAQKAPYTAYGVGQKPGSVVEGFILLKSCGKTTVKEDGTWKLPIPSDAPCSPKEGDTISFRLEVRGTEVARWTPGGSPTKGIAIIDSVQVNQESAVPTGNADLLGSKGTAMALVLMMAVAAAALVAGARTAMRER